MAGKRLIDAAKLFNAGSSVAKQHFQLRRQQWDVYSNTSTLAKAVKNQTDRVTVTAAAAIELAKRFNEEPPEWQRARAYQEAEQASREDRQTKGPQADSSNWRASVNESKIQEAESERPIVQEEGLGALDQDDGTRSSLRKRELQRQAERQIPKVSADSQPDNRQGQDTFHERSESSSPDLSSLPRSKLPRHAEDTPAPESALRDVDQDVYPQPTHQPAIDTPSGINTDVYSSPKVARMLGQTTGDFKNPYAGRQKLPPKPLPEMLAAQERWQKQEQASASQPHASNDDAETQDLAASIAQEAETQSQPADPALSEKPAEVQYEMRESRVPSSRFGRIWQYGSLATGMAFGAVGESVRRITGGESTGSLMLSEDNMSRLVAKLSRMRGAALKLGQMMSFQDSKILPPAINQVLQRVQDSADYMPPSQRDQVLIQNLGQDWRDLFSHFEERPFAAASIGQVHKATLKSNGKPVAVKVQYPGVRNSIDSDLNNLSLLLTASRLLPKGLFLDRTIANARTELGWECDYERELRACSRFRDLLKDESDVFVVPEAYPEASGPGVLTAEFMTGKAVTKIHDLTQQDRDWMGTHLLRLCLRELMEWRFMQTDPNWTNFLYNRQSQKLELLDFGASRDFPDKFVVPYVALLIAASKDDRAACRDLSIDLGYLTGHESAAMTRAHVDSILTLAEPFVESAPDVYDFQDQTITDRVRANIGLMLRERMAPPPEETYSLHRKLSGAFLLCARLRSKVPARSMFADAVGVWEGREGKVERP